MTTSTSRQGPAHRPDPLLGCPGEMGAAVAAHDWAATPLGAVEGWSAALRTAVSMVLRSRYPMILSWGEELVVVYNDAFVPTLGAKHPHALGSTLPVEFAEVWDAVGPMQREVLAGGESTWFEDLPLVIERGDGPEETFFTFSYSHVPDPEGVGGVLAVLSVTTDAVVGQRRLSVLADLAAVASDELDVRSSAERICAVLAAASGELEAASVVHAGTGARLAGFGTLPVAPVLLDAGPEHRLLLAPHPLRRRDAEHDRFLDLLAQTCGQVLGAAASRAAERSRLEAMARLDEAKSRFLASVSHEFRTPLTLVLGPLEDVLTGHRDALDRDDVGRLHAQAVRLLRLVESLLDAARIDAGGLVARCVPVDAGRLTDELVRGLAPAAQRHGTVLRLDDDDDAPARSLDPDLWERIVVNLVGNAVKHTRQGLVSVELLGEGDALRLVVTDTGLGIPEEHQDLVFDRFHRVPGTDVEGTGLGLSIVADAARALGGSVALASRLGEGTRVVVQVPAAPVELGDGPPGAPGASPTSSESSVRRLPPLDLDGDLDRDPDGGRDGGVDGASAAPGDPVDHDGPRILVVDDEGAMRRRTAEVLAELGHVVEARDGAEALELVRAGGIDLVVSDVMMPRLDGVGLVGKLRADAAVAGTPVVLLSARAGSEAATEGVAAGADDYVVKPFTRQELLARCRTTLELSRLRADAASETSRTTLLAGVSHDMQTPLAVLLAGLEALTMPSLSAAERALLIGRMVTRAEQLRRLVGQLIDWSRLTAAQPLPVAHREVDLAALLRHVADAATGGDALVGAVPPGDPAPWAWCDDVRTERVLHVLVDNAVGSGATVVRLSCAIEGGRPVVRVSDDGPGVHPAILRELFTAFARRPSRHGTGLGLFVARESARAQGGDLVLESTSASGSTFRLDLPSTGSGPTDGGGS